MNEILQMILAFVAARIGDIASGAALSTLRKDFNKEALLTGLYKSACMLIAIICIFAVGTLVPSIQVVINEQPVTILQALQLGILSGVVYYATSALNKAYKIFKTKAEVAEMDQYTSQPDVETGLDTTNDEEVVG